MAVQTSAGTTMAVSDALPATNDDTGFAALTWEDVGEVTDLGEFGRQYNLVTHLPLGSRQLQKFKGSFDDGKIAVQLGRDTSDAGQVDLEAGLASDNNYSFRITIQDGTIFYFQAKVMSFTTGVGGADSITGGTVNLEIDQAIVRV